MGRTTLAMGMAAAITFLAAPTAAPAQQAADLGPVHAGVPDPPTGTLSCSDPVLVGGMSTTISYSNSDMAGQTITILISNGDGSTQVVEIDLDENGNGSTTWIAPSGWQQAEFLGPQGETLIRVVD